MDGKLIIRQIDFSDIDDLTQIAVATFSETFAETNSPENMEKYLSTSFDKDKFIRELKDPESWFYFGIVDGEIAGYLKLNAGNSQTEIRDENGFEVERIYVLEKYYGKGVGASLFEFAIEMARERKCTYIWLGVFEENFRAQRFYKKYGFYEFDEHIFVLGDSKQRDVLMRVEI